MSALPLFHIGPPSSAPITGPHSSQFKIGWSHLYRMEPSSQGIWGPECPKLALAIRLNHPGYPLQPPGQIGGINRAGGIRQILPPSGFIGLFRTIIYQDCTQHLRFCNVHLCPCLRGRVCYQVATDLILQLWGIRPQNLLPRRILLGTGTKSPRWRVQYP